MMSLYWSMLNFLKCIIRILPQFIVFCNINCNVDMSTNNSIAKEFTLLLISSWDRYTYILIWINEKVNESLIDSDLKFPIVSSKLLQSYYVLPSPSSSFHLLHSHPQNLLVAIAPLAIVPSLHRLLFLSLNIYVKNT